MPSQMPSQELENSAIDATTLGNGVEPRIRALAGYFVVKAMLSLLYRLADRARRRARRASWTPDLAAGRRGEDLAHRFLRREGLTVVARNYRPRAGAGEIDLIAWEKGELAFIEVKTRATGEFGMPETAVDPDKQVYVERAARDYVRRTGVDWGVVRFDIVSILLTSPPEIRFFRDAFRPRRTL